MQATTWMNLQNIMPSNKSQTQNSAVSFHLFETLEKTDLICSDRKQINDCLKPGVEYGDWLGREDYLNRTFLR